MTLRFEAFQPNSKIRRVIGSSLRQLNHKTGR